MIRNVAGRPVSIDPASSDDDFAVALTWLKTDEAARRVSRDTGRRTSQEHDRRIHTCKLCGRYDRTANSGKGVAADQWCEPCRDDPAPTGCSNMPPSSSTATQWPTSSPPTLEQVTT